MGYMLFSGARGPLRAAATPGPPACRDTRPGQERTQYLFDWSARIRDDRNARGIEQELQWP